MNTPSQVQRGRKRKADKPHQPNSGYVHQNRGYQQPLNENQRRQQATFNSLSALQDKPFPQTPQAGHAVTSGLTVGDIGAGMAPGISIDDEFADNVVGQYQCMHSKEWNWWELLLLILHQSRTGTFLGKQREQEHS